MKLFIALLSIFIYSVGFASAKKVDVEFSYTDTGIESASLWMDDLRACTSEPITPTEPNTYIFECDSVMITAGEHTFHMTAVLSGSESGPSNQFPFTIELKVVKDFKLVIK